MALGSDMDGLGFIGLDWAWLIWLGKEGKEIKFTTETLRSLIKECRSEGGRKEIKSRDLVE